MNVRERKPARLTEEICNGGIRFCAVQLVHVFMESLQIHLFIYINQNLAQLIKNKSKILGDILFTSFTQMAKQILWN